MEILAGKMQRDQAAGASRIQVHRSSLEVKESAQPVDQHGRRDAHRGMLLLGVIVLLQDTEIIVCEAPSVDRGIRTRALADRNARCAVLDYYKTQESRGNSQSSRA
jgi:hypothetical protein